MWCERAIEKPNGVVLEQGRKGSGRFDAVEHLMFIIANKNNEEARLNREGNQYQVAFPCVYLLCNALLLTRLQAVCIFFQLKMDSSVNVFTLEEWDKYLGLQFPSYSVLLVHLDNDVELVQILYYKGIFLVH